MRGGFVAMLICREAAEKSKVKVREMNLLEATRFLMLTMTKAEIRRSRIRHLLPKRRRVPVKRVGVC